MAYQVLIPALDDNEILSSSPLIVLDSLYYEFFYKKTTDQTWTQKVFDSPLPMFDLGSPMFTVPCVVLDPVDDSSVFNYQVRRFDHDNNPSKWTSGTFTTP